MDRIDELTGLNGIIYLVKNYDDYIKKRENTYVISIDFRKLKYINDNFGHAAGDKSILLFVRLIKENFEDSIFIRRSGDEFVVITSLMKKEIETKIEDIHKLIENEFNEGKIPIAFQFNCGIIEANNNLEDTLHKADITMYRAKNHNHSFEYYNKRILLDFKRDQKFIKSIDKLFETNQPQYLFQAIHHLNSEEVGFYEIYTRDKKLNSIFENEKYEILKTNFRLKKIDMKNINNLFDNIIPSAGRNKKYMISINYQTLLSTEYDFASYVENLIKQNNLIAENICFNILMIDYEQKIDVLVNVLDKLKKMGILISIENFNFVEKQFLIPIICAAQVDYVKIPHKAIVKAMNEQRINIVFKNIIKILEELSISPIFSNIEEQSEKDFIVKNSKNGFIKGYVYSKELTLEQIKKIS